MTSKTDQRMDELESRLAFQEDVIDNLNRVVTRQDREIIELKQRLASLAARVKECGDSAAVAGSASGFEIPPHY